MERLDNHPWDRPGFVRRDCEPHPELVDFEL